MPNDKPITLDVLADRMSTNAEALQDIRDNMVTKDLYTSEMSTLRDSITTEKTERVAAVADLKVELLGKVTEVTTRLDTAATKRGNLQNIIIGGAVVAGIGAVITLVVAVFATVGHLP